MSRAETVQLPDSYLGNNRHFEAILESNNFDIILAAWHEDATKNRLDLTRFGISHSSQAAIIANFLGYLSHAGYSNEQKADAVKQLIDTFSQVDFGLYSSINEFIMQDVANGEDYSIYDEKEAKLHAISTPMSAQPGRIERLGGTGFYMHITDLGRLALVLAKHKPSQQSTNYFHTKITDTAYFCETDIPAMALAVGSTAEGDDKKAVAKLLRNIFPNN